MSSTGRSSARSGHQFDHYVTPDWIIREYFGFLESSPLILERHLALAQHGILDPCAGGEKNSDVLMPYPEALIESAFKDCPIITSDIRADSRADIIGDFLQMDEDDLPLRPGFVISNPPYTIAQQFVQKGLDIVRDDGVVTMLLRIGFLGSAKRFPWFKSHMPEFIIIHHKRPSFTSDGKTDSDYYAHISWRKGYHPEESRTIIL